LIRVLPPPSTNYTPFGRLETVHTALPIRAAMLRTLEIERYIVRQGKVKKGTRRVGSLTVFMKYKCSSTKSTRGHDQVYMRMNGGRCEILSRNTYLVVTGYFSSRGIPNAFVSRYSSHKITII
jgi:hypothetical protein